MPKNKLNPNVKDLVGTATYIPTKTHLVVWGRYFRDEPDAIDDGFLSVNRLKDFSFGKWTDFWLAQLFRVRSKNLKISDYHIWIEIPYELIEVTNPGLYEHF